MNIYQAVFNHKPGDEAAARKAFIESFGVDPFEKWINPYLDDSQPGFIFSSPSTQHVFGFIEKLTQAVAARLECEYELPYQFMAVAPGLAPTETCGVCGRVIAAVAAVPGDDGYTKVCLRCKQELSNAEIKRAVSSLDAS